MSDFDTIFLDDSPLDESGDNSVFGELARSKGQSFCLIIEETDYEWPNNPLLGLNYNEIKEKFLHMTWTTEAKRKIMAEFKLASKYKGNFSNFRDFYNHWEDRCTGITRDDSLVLEKYIDNLPDCVRNACFERGFGTLTELKIFLNTVPERGLDWKISAPKKPTYSNTGNMNKTACTQINIIPFHFFLF